MKETVTVNIGSEAFTLDDDACRTLRCYLDDIRSRLPEDDTETMGDIERRIAEIFRERVSSPMRVITLDVVRATMNQMGTPAAFGEPRRDAAAGAPENGDPAPKEDETPSPRKLYRSRTERSIAGVCGGLGEYFDADPTMIRLVTLLLILFGGLSIWAYIILWIVIPEQPARKFTLNERQQAVIPLAGQHHRRRMRRSGGIFRTRRIAGPHRHPHSDSFRRSLALGLHHPLADRAQGPETLKPLKPWPKTT